MTVRPSATEAALREAMEKIVFSVLPPTSIAGQGVTAILDEYEAALRSRPAPDALVEALTLAEKTLDACHKYHGDDCLIPGPCACSTLPTVRAALAAARPSTGEPT